MNKLVAPLLLCLMLLSGCQDVKISGVMEGQPAPHAGYNFGPDSYVHTGDEVKVSGVLIWIDGLDPNDLSN